MQIGRRLNPRRIERSLMLVAADLDDLRIALSPGNRKRNLARGDRALGLACLLTSAVSRVESCVNEIRATRARKL
jgi:hypothetical protein